MKRALAACALALVGCGDASPIDAPVTDDPIGVHPSIAEPIPAARRERSLVWTDAALLDDPATAGLGRLMAVASDERHGGVLFDRWFRRFASTAHSERAAPAQWAVDIATEQGTDPSTWDLDAIEFTVTAVHNRIDLAASGGCGELRVSLASTHPVYAPLHLIFLFRQPATALDVADDGTRHCRATARRWSHLSDLDGEAFRDAARDMLDDTLVSENFLLAESLELTVSPWEWRQWVQDESGAFENPPMFQTVDTPRLNTPGPLRDAFGTWVEDHAGELVDRTIEIPEAFRATSSRVAPSVPAEPLDLGHVDAAVRDAYPDLGHQIEIVGCPTCHTTEADFVHTKPDRTFSDFYDAELDARAVRLDLMHRQPVAAPPFGPLQSL